MSEIKYPYIPDGRVIQYVPEIDDFMALACVFAAAQSLDAVLPGAAVIVKNGRTIGIGANGGDFHKFNKCQ